MGTRKPLQWIVISALAVSASFATEGGKTESAGAPKAAKAEQPAVHAAETKVAGATQTFDLDKGNTIGKSEGSAVVEKILQDKEDLMSGKRFSYDPGGRRDPFRSLLEQVARFRGPRPKGIKGMLIAEADLIGTVRDPKGNIAFFKGADNKGYFLRVGEELYDGRILSIDPEAGAVTFRQQVDDPRQIKPYRDIVKKVTTQPEEEAQ